MQKLAVVTGGEGFVGSHLCKRLHAEGWRVVSLDNHLAGSDTTRIDGVEYRVGHTKDIAAIVEETPDILYHLGEYSRVEVSLTEPAVVFDANIVGTMGVLEFCREKKCKLVYAGSSTKFADGGLGRDQSPYAFTKALNTELVRNYGNWYNLPYAITYFYNVFGPGERVGKYGTVVEIFLQKVLRGEPIMVNAPGTQRRNFTHVDDIVDGLMVVGEKGEGDDFGIGNPHSYSILELVELMGATAHLQPAVQGNRQMSIIDISKIEALGLCPSRSLKEYIRERLEKK
jgi:UDP-glucose 4-epimerase